MSKQQYRSELEIVSVILSVIMDYGRDGVIISSIGRKANMSHKAAIEKCQKLVSLGLIETINSRKNRTFFITEKGIQFFREIQKFRESVQEIRIRF